MSLRAFAKAYEAALATQDWSVVAPLISDEACVTFSDGSRFDGKAAIKIAYERNFQTIKGEEYRIENVRWLLEAEDGAAYVFDFHWRGVIEGRVASGSGRGTAVLAKIGDRWMLVAEHLGPKRG
jgi:ketosteroid isomerase-like protein